MKGSEKSYGVQTSPPFLLNLAMEKLSSSPIDSLIKADNRLADFFAQAAVNNWVFPVQSVSPDGAIEVVQSRAVWVTVESVIDGMQCEIKQIRLVPA